MFIENIGEIFVEDCNQHIIESGTWILRGGFIYGETGFYAGQYFHLILGEEMWLPEARKLKAQGLEYFFCTEAGEFESWGDAVKSLDGMPIGSIGFISQCSIVTGEIDGIGEITIDETNMDLLEGHGCKINTGGGLADGYIERDDGKILPYMIAQRMGLCLCCHIGYRDGDKSNNKRENIYECE